MITIVKENENGYLDVTEVSEMIPLLQQSGFKEMVVEKKPDGSLYTYYNYDGSVNYEMEEKLNTDFKIAEALKYLNNTDWVDNYKTRHDLGLEILPEDSSKWTIINKREEYKQYLKENE